MGNALGEIGLAIDCDGAKVFLRLDRSLHAELPEGKERTGTFVSASLNSS